MTEISINISEMFYANNSNYSKTQAIPCRNAGGVGPTHLCFLSHFAIEFEVDVSILQSLWRIAIAIPDMRLPSRPKSTVTTPWRVLVSRSAKGRTLSWPGWLLHIETTAYRRTVTHPSTGRARRRATSLTWQMSLPIGQTSTHGYTPDKCWGT